MSSRTLLSTRIPATLSPSQRHDLSGGHPDRAAPCHVRDQSIASHALAASFDQSDRLPVDLEINLGVRSKSQPFPDVDGNGDLSFGGDPHFLTLTSNTTPRRWQGQLLIGGAPLLSPLGTSNLR